jgi:uncharacterized protein (TIGR03382 family)
MRVGRLAALPLFAVVAACGGEQLAPPVKLDKPPAMFTRAFNQATKPAPNLTYRGGRLLKQPEYFNIYWGQYWQTGDGKDDKSYYDSFMTTMAGNARFMSVTQEYSRAEEPIGTGMFHGSLYLTSEPTQQLDDNAIRDMLRAQISAGTLPVPMADQVFVVYLPPGLDVTAGGDKSCNQFCGYHWTFYLGGINRDVPYIVLPHPDCWGCRFAVLHDISLTELNRDSTTVILSHEMIETATDPEPGSGWYDDANGEVSDICGGSDGWFDQGELLGFRVQKHWSNAKQSCVIEQDIPVPSGGGCPATTHQQGGLCVPDMPASCASAGAAPAWSLLLAFALLWRRRRSSAT